MSRDRRSGYVVLAPDEKIGPGHRMPTRAEVEEALAALGLGPWGGDGFPALVVLTPQATKGDYFEAGYWGGAGVPLVFLGGGHAAARRGRLVRRFGGWRAAAGLGDLPALVHHLVPPGAANAQETA
jgi:hypothetical protein